MPASILHKSAQQEAPDAYISVCKSTNLYMRAQKDARATYCARGQDMHARHSNLRACKDARTASLARVQDIRALLLPCAQRCTQGPLLHASKRCPRGLLGVRTRHARAASSCVRLKMAVSTAARAKMLAPPPATRDAKMHASGRLRGGRPSLSTSVLSATFS